MHSFSPPRERPVGSHRQALGVVSRIAAVGASGASVEERTEEVLDALRLTFPFDGAMVVAADPGNRERRAVATRDYSEFVCGYLRSSAWHDEMVAPFGLPAGGWPIRERDLPVDPASVTGLACCGRDEGFNEGILSTLVTDDGRYAGFLIMSWLRAEPPPEEACVVIGHIAPTLTNIIDPVRSAQTLVAALDPDCSAAAFASDHSATVLRGTVPPELLELDSPARRMLDRMRRGGQTTGTFIWPSERSVWHACRLFRCNHDISVLTMRPLIDVHGMTRRELEVLSGLAAGRSNAEIAQELWVTVRTARAHVEHILQKLDVPTRAGAVARAVEEGLLPPRF